MSCADCCICYKNAVQSVKEIQITFDRSIDHQKYTFYLLKTTLTNWGNLYILMVSAGNSDLQEIENPVAENCRIPARNINTQMCLERAEGGLSYV